MSVAAELANAVRTGLVASTDIPRLRMPFHVEGTEPHLKPCAVTWKALRGTWEVNLITEPTSAGVYEHKGRRLRVISATELAKYPDGSEEIGPQWHVSVCRVVAGRLLRCSDEDVALVATVFSIPRIEEDNHHPGKARHLWCPVDPTRRVDCECKEGETTITEPDGYQWQDDPEKPGCRRCEMAALHGGACDIHPETPR